MLAFRRRRSSSRGERRRARAGRRAGAGVVLPSRKIQNPNAEFGVRMAARIQGRGHVKIQIANLESRLEFLQSCRPRNPEFGVRMDHPGGWLQEPSRTQNPESGIRNPCFRHLGICKEQLAFSHLFYSLLCRQGVQNPDRKNSDGFCKAPYMTRRAAVVRGRRSSGATRHP